MTVHVGTVSGGILYTGGSDTDPFQIRKPKDPKTIRAVQVGKDNLPALAYRVVKHSRVAVWIPPDHSSIQIGDKRFDVGEWIIEEYNVTLMEDMYRHPTEVETQAYGLTTPDLKG